MRRTLTSSLLSLLLLTTLVWGGCISCEQYFMRAGAKSCCAADGHCKTKVPKPSNSGRECKQIAFDHQKSIHLNVDLPVVAVETYHSRPPKIEIVAFWRGTFPADPSPPDLQVLHSTFLI